MGMATAIALLGPNKPNPAVMHSIIKPGLSASSDTLTSPLAKSNQMPKQQPADFKHQ
jgi:hypothetical protein